MGATPTSCHVLSALTVQASREQARSTRRSLNDPFKPNLPHEEENPATLWFKTLGFVQAIRKPKAFTSMERAVPCGVFSRHRAPPTGDWTGRSITVGEEAHVPLASTIIWHGRYTRF